MNPADLLILHKHSNPEQHTIIRTTPNKSTTCTLHQDHIHKNGILKHRI